MESNQRTQAETALDMPRSATGRKDQGQPAVIKLESLATRLPDLIKLHTKAEEAATDFKEAVKTAAENSGLLSATVSSFVKAKAGDKFDEKKEKVAQMALVFDEVA